MGFALVQSLLLRLSLHYRIAVFVSTILLAVFLAFGYVAREAVNRSTEATLQERQSTALMVARHLDDLIGHAHVHLVVVAGDLSAQSGELGGDQTERVLAQSLHHVQFFFSHLLVFDPQRRLIASTPAAAVGNLDIEAQAVLDGVLRSGQPAISNVLPLPVKGSFGVLFAAPIVRNEHVMGVVAAEMPLPHPSISSLASALRMGRSGHMEVLDGRGRILASSLEEEVGQQSEHPDFFLPLLAAETSTVGRALGGRYGRGDEADIEAFAPLTSAPWGVALGQAEDETFAAARELRDRALIVAALALLVALCCTWVGTQSVVHPVQALTHAGERMATGDLSEPILMAQADEVGRLAQVLEVMRQRLGQSLAEIRAWNQELGRRVSERTRDLETSNRHLQALMAVATAAGGGTDLQSALGKALHELVDTIHARGAWAFLWDEQQQQLRLVSDYGLPEALRTTAISVVCPDAVCIAALRGSAMLHHPLRNCPALPEALRQRADDTVCWCAPIHVGEEPLGVLCLAMPSDRVLDADELALVLGIAQQVAVAFQNARLTEERTRLEATQRMELLRAEFLASVSHELRTPLGFIKGYATTLLRDDVAWESDQHKEFLQIIDEECDRLANLVESLLDAARAQAGRLYLHLQPVPLEHVLRRSIERMAGTLVSHRVELHLAASPTIVADESRLEQVVVNLLQNAVKYSPKGGPIEVVLGVREQQVQVSVLDRGLGVPAAEASKVFEPFYRVSNGPAASVGGAGLGLTVCRAIVEAHGGRIWAEPRPDGGTAVHFTLPLHSEGSGERRGTPPRATAFGTGN